MTAYLSSPLTLTLTVLLGVIAWIVVSVYRDALRERRKKQAQEDAAIIAKLKAAGERKWEGHEQ